MAQKPGIPKGTRDFSPTEVAKRNYIISIIKNHFETYGFQPIETPSFENSETLMGKYGDEGDRLIFKILDSGDFLKKIDQLSDFKNYVSNNIKKIDDEIKHIIIQNNYSNVDYYKKDFLSIMTFNLRRKFGDGNRFFNDETIIKKLVDYNFLLEYNFGKNIDYLNRFIEETYKNIRSSIVASKISEKALRYDLTVPFARYVVMHQNEIDFPFKRYQVQPVWRADRPQKGRFREFYQCDADVVGSDSLWQEVEFVQLYDAVFSSLKIEGATVKLNNRKILSGIAEVIGAKDKLIDFTVALDKLDKIGEEGVKKEMLQKSISEDAIEKVQPLFNFTGSNSEKLDKLKKLLSTSEEGSKGVEELKFIIDTVGELGLKSAQLVLDITLARGLNYYTGAIFEVAAPKEVQLGSIGGGGRYDDLTGIFGLKKVSGVGISFGLDRIYMVLEELNLFPETVSKSLDVMFTNFGQKEAFQSLKIIQKLRESGIKAELYPDNAKMARQMKYADKRNIPFVVVIGEEELGNHTCILKDMVSGEQKTLSVNEIVNELSNRL